MEFCFFHVYFTHIFDEYFFFVPVGALRVFLGSQLLILKHVYVVILTCLSKHVFNSLFICMFLFCGTYRVLSPSWSLPTQIYSLSGGQSPPGASGPSPPSLLSHRIPVSIAISYLKCFITG